MNTEKSVTSLWIIGSITRGVITEVIAKPSHSYNGQDYYTIPGFSGKAYHRLGRDVFKTEKEASEIANKRRLARIASLEKQIERLKKTEWIVQALSRDQETE